ncbi:MAG: ribonuclease H-like domain-containing protein [Patescibacteria group bacterium]|nr:ribonuclease H-like domain-containing protein [Patescibacteria group bacterium]
MSDRTEIVLDIETQNTFQDVGAYKASLLKISVVGVYFYETDTWESFLEADLPKLWPRLERSSRIIGYNLFGFDYPCMQTYYTGNIMSLPTVDILLEIEKRLGFRIKLDTVAQATLGMGKSGDGLQAVRFWKEGRIDELKDYCLQDVRVTRDIYEKALEEKQVAYFDRLGQKQIIPLPIMPAETQQSPQINLSLGL